MLTVFTREAILRDGRERVRCNREERVAENELWKLHRHTLARTNTPRCVHRDVHTSTHVYTSTQGSVKYR